MEVIRLHKATFAYQPSEWGITKFQGLFSRLKDRFIYKEHGERKIKLQCVILP